MPFTAETRADAAGRFKFKSLVSGPYTLVVAGPKLRETSKTVEIGPNLADGRSVVLTEIEVPADAVKQDHAVSVSTLAVPESARREYAKAEDLLTKRDVKAALEHLRKAAAIAPKFTAALNYLGIISYNAGQFSDAEQHFRQALDDGSSPYAPLVNLGGTLLAQGKIRESLGINLRAVEARPGDALAHAQLGSSYFYLEQLDEAEAHLKRAKALDPAHYSNPHLLLATIYRQRGNRSAELTELEEFLTLHPDSKLADKVRARIALVRSRASTSGAQ
jgi:tetratricopeptide (TPR) repeat protein